MRSEERLDDNSGEEPRYVPVSLEELTAYRIELLERLLNLVQSQNQAIAQFADDRTALMLALQQILSDMAAITEEQGRIDKIIAGIDNAVDRPGRSTIDGAEDVQRDE
jgi:hypothetical protein